MEPGEYQFESELMKLQASMRKMEQQQQVAAATATAAAAAAAAAAASAFEAAASATKAAASATSAAASAAASGSAYPTGADLIGKAPNGAPVGTHFVFATSGFPTDARRRDLEQLGFVTKGPPGLAYLDIKGWAAGGFAADGTPRMANAIRRLHDDPVFGPLFDRQFLMPEAPPVTLFHLAAPGCDTGPNHPKYLDALITSLKAILAANPLTQLVVCGYGSPDCLLPWWPP